MTIAAGLFVLLELFPRPVLSVTFATVWEPPPVGIWASAEEGVLPTAGDFLAGDGWVPAGAPELFFGEALGMMSLRTFGGLGRPAKRFVSKRDVGENCRFALGRSWLVSGNSVAIFGDPVCLLDPTMME